MQTSRLYWLSGLLILQTLCATFFMFDASADWLGMEAVENYRHYHGFEMCVALALVAGLIATLVQIRDLMRRQAAMRRQLDVASGAFADLIERQFEDWGLSASERDVAMMSLKGLSVAEIASIRETKEGTIKAQSAAVYRKADVSGRLQLMSVFIEELLAAPLLDERPQES